jgi:cyclopropane fatty-acyl-phospholipid synthase-like methyltransferase
MAEAGSDTGSGSPNQRETVEEWDAVYAGAPPWDIGRPQATFLRLAETGQLRGPLLDVGCGTGEHALMAEALGLEVTGVDVAPAAIRVAQRKAEDRKLAPRLLEWDALELASLGEHYVTVLDSGVFHVFNDEDRRRYVESLSSVTVSGGRYHMLCFSDRQPGDWGPRRVTQSEIRDSFSEGWHVESIEPAIFEITISPDGAQAWLAAIRRL